MASTGFTVTFVYTEHSLHRILRAQGDAAIIPIAEDVGLDIHLVAISDGLPLELDRDAYYLEYLDAVQVALHVEFDKLIAKLNLQGSLVTCIISDWFLPWSQDVANKFNIPRILFWPQSVSVFAIYAHTPLLVSKGFMDASKGRVKDGCFKESANLLSCTVPGLPRLRGVDLPYMNVRIEAITRWLYRLIDQNNRRFSEAAWILSNTFYELEDEVIEALQIPISSVGPLLPSAFLGGISNLDNRFGPSFWKEDECLHWLDTQATHTVLYVSVGSHVDLSKTLIQEIALGLKASQQPFLWVIRGHSGVETLSETLPEGYLEETKEQGLIVPWSPQLLVLSHPAIGGFLTHGGWNSTLESISMGVPMIVWPWFLDQRTDCRLIAERWKIGMELVTLKEGQDEQGLAGAPPLEPEMGRLEVERCVRILMQEEEGREMRRRVGKLMNQAKKAAMDGGSSNKTLHLFMDDMILRAQNQHK